MERVEPDFGQVLTLFRTNDCWDLIETIKLSEGLKVISHPAGFVPARRLTSLPYFYKVCRFGRMSDLRQGDA